MEEGQLKVYYDVVLNNLSNMVYNVSGLGVVKKVITHMTSEKTCKIIRDYLLENSLNLIQNSYGNYAIQGAIEVIIIKLII